MKIQASKIKEKEKEKINARAYWEVAIHDIGCFMLKEFRVLTRWHRGHPNRRSQSLIADAEQITNAKCEQSARAQQMEQFWGQFNKEVQVYFTSRNLAFTNSLQFECTKSLYKSPLAASNLYLQVVFYLIQSVISRKFICALCSCKKDYSCSFFIELAPGEKTELEEKVTKLGWPKKLYNCVNI